MNTVCQECGKNDPKFVCSRCKTVRYCSVDCQKKNWKKHKAECIPQNKEKVSKELHCRENRDISIHLQQYLQLNYPNITFVKTVKGYEHLGRCLIAARSFKERDILFDEEPLESVPGIENGVYRACFYCGSICIPKLSLSCKSCDCSYCSSDCMEADHERHRVLCNAVQFIQNVHIDENHSHIGITNNRSLWLLAIAILHHQRQSESTKLGYDDFLNLCEHDRSVDSKTLQNEIQTIAKQYCSFISDNSLEDTLLHIYYRLILNIFPIQASYRCSTGYGCYIVSSFLNHDCSPNCAISFDGLTLRVSALRKITKGEMLTINYNSNSFILDPYVYINRLPFDCQCPLSIQHTLNEQLIGEWINGKQNGLNSSIKNDPFYLHRRFSCSRCVSAHKIHSNYLILHSSESAYVCLQCGSVFEKGSSEYNRIHNCQLRIDGFLDSCKSKTTLRDFMPLFNDPELVATFPYDSYCWTMAYIKACSVKPSFDKNTIVAFIRLLNGRFVDIDTMEPFSTDKSLQYEVTVKMIHQLLQSTEIDVMSKKQLRERMEYIMGMWASELAKSHSEDTVLGKQWEECMNSCSF